MTDVPEKSLDGFQPIMGDERTKKDQERLALYEKGLVDREIADATGVTKDAIWLWRKKMGLPANGGVRKGVKTVEKKKKSSVMASDVTENTFTEEADAGNEGRSDAASADMQTEEEAAPAAPGGDIGEAETAPATPRFTLDKPNQINVGVLEQLLRKVADGWPEARLEMEDGSAIDAAGLRIDYGTDGKEEDVVVVLCRRED